MTGQRKADANRANGRKSKGPTSARGKIISSRNSLKHGLLCQDMKIPEELRPNFEDLHDRLLAELRPDGALQDFYFEEIVTSIWKLKLLFRVEMEALSRTECEANDQNRSVTELARISKTDLNMQIKFLEELKEAVRRSGATPLRGNYRQSITNTFGEEFYKSLVEWDTADHFNLALVRAMKEKAKRFNQPPLLVEEEAKHMPEFTADPQERADMIQKLISAKQKYLEEVYRLKSGNEMSAAETLTARVDLQLRYSSALKRDLWRAIQQFYELRKPL